MRGLANELSDAPESTAPQNCSQISQAVGSY